MQKVIEFLEMYRKFRSTPIVDDDFPQLRDTADFTYMELSKVFSNFKNVGVICLCGSTKFKDEFIALNKKLTLQGNIVLTCGFFAHADDEPITDEQKKALDELHKRKIDLADIVFIINVDGYVGESTRSEIEYAAQQKKVISYLM